MENYKKNKKILEKSFNYSSEMEHDACGVGLIASTNGKKSRKIVEYGIEALKAIWHRGAVDADGKSGGIYETFVLGDNADGFEFLSALLNQTDLDVNKEVVINDSFNDYGGDPFVMGFEAEAGQFFSYNYNSFYFDNAVIGVFYQDDQGTESVSDDTFELVGRYEYSDYSIDEDGYLTGNTGFQAMQLADAGNYFLVVDSAYFYYNEYFSDDYYYENAFSIVKEYFEKFTSIDFLFGTVKKYKLHYGYEPKKIFWTFGFYSSHSVGFFIKTVSQKKIGQYNIKYKYSSDYDLFFRMIVKEKMNGMATQKNEILGNFGLYGLSSKLRYIDYLNENNSIDKKSLVSMQRDYQLAGEVINNLFRLSQNYNDSTLTSFLNLKDVRLYTLMND